MQTTSRFLILLYLLIIVCWAWSALHPSHTNWGFHLFAFYPSWVAALSLGILLLFLVPNVRRGTEAVFRRFTNWCSRHAQVTSLVVLGGTFALAMYLFPSRLHLLGDGDIILQLTPNDPNVKDLSNNFRDNPLMYSVVRTTQFLIGGGSPVEVVNAYRQIGFVVGLCFLLLIVLFVNQLKISVADRVMIGCLLFFTTRLQFYFGYVENYAVLSLLISAYTVTGWLVLKDRLHSIFAFLCFLLILGFHLGGIAFFPSLLVIVFHAWRKSRKEIVLSMFSTVSAAIPIYFLAGFSIRQIVERFGNVYHGELLPVHSSYYSIFSLYHFLDWTNALGLVLPFSFVGAIVLLFPLFRSGKLRWNDELLIFLLSSSACALALTLVISPALGMARDWDLLATFFIPPSFLFIYCVLPALSVVNIRQVVFMMILLQAVQVAAWIGINGDETRHLRRAEMLTDSMLSGTIPKMYYESLGKAFWQRHEFRNSLKWYERYLAIDSTNPRILANVTDLYGRLGENDKLFDALKRCAASSRDPAVFSNLGVEFLKRGDTAGSIRTFNHALSIDTTFSTAHANLALVYAMQKKNSLVVQHATKAIAAGWDNPTLYKLAGDACVRMNDFPQAMRNYDAYLAREPNDTQTKSVRDRIKRMLAGR